MASTILIIDDSQIARSVLSKQCESLGYSTITAESGEEGLEIIHREDIDLIITDILMPGISGEDLIRQVKSIPSLSAIPILVISTQSSQESVTRCIGLGADDLLSKPFIPEILHARVRSSIAKAEHHKKEIQMREKKAAEKCSQEMIGAICHNFNQVLTTGMCNIAILSKLLSSLTQHCSFVRANIGEDALQQCNSFSDEFYANNKKCASLVELFNELHKSANDTNRSFLQIGELIKNLSSIVRPTSVNYTDNTSIIDFDQSMKYTVLVASKNEACQTRYIEEVASMGHHVISAISSQDAISQAHFKSPHMAILDFCDLNNNPYEDILRLKHLNELNLPIMAIVERNDISSTTSFSEQIETVITKATADDGDFLKTTINKFLKNLEQHKPKKVSAHKQQQCF